MKRSLFTVIGVLAVSAQAQAGEPTARRPVGVSLAETPRPANVKVFGERARRSHESGRALRRAALRAAAPGGSNIVGGAPTSGNPEVAFLIGFDAGETQNVLCTGTLIAPKLILTAAHCVDDHVFEVASYEVYFGTDRLDPEDPGLLFVTSATSIAFHPDWNIDDLDAGNDIAVMHLADEVPIEPAAIRTQPLGAADLGAPLSLVGWGITGGGQEDSGLKRQVTSRLDEVSDNLVVVGNPDTNTCSGDSGGPAFYDAGAGPEIIGVTSFGDADCREYGISTRVDAFLAFIEANSVPGGGPGGGGGFGDGCSEGAQCESGVCVVDANGENGFCSELCDGASCPGGSECAAIDAETSVCLPAEQSDAGQLGDACTSGDDCDSGLCATSATGGMCTAECESATDCPNGFSCEAVDGASVCLLDESGTGGFPTPIPSEEEGGCSAGGGAGGGAAMLLLLALVPMVRRRSPSRASR